MTDSAAGLSRRGSSLGRHPTTRRRAGRRPPDRVGAGCRFGPGQMALPATIQQAPRAGLRPAYGIARSSGGGDEALADGSGGELGSALGVQLLEDVPQVVLDRVLADPELGGDLLVAGPRSPGRARRALARSAGRGRAGGGPASRSRRTNSSMIRAAVAGAMAASPRPTASIIDRSWAASRFLRR